MQPLSCSIVGCDYFCRSPWSWSLACSVVRVILTTATKKNYLHLVDIWYTSCCMLLFGVKKFVSFTLDDSYVELITWKWWRCTFFRWRLHACAGWFPIVRRYVSGWRLNLCCDHQEQRGSTTTFAELYNIMMMYVWCMLSLLFVISEMKPAWERVNVYVFT